MSKHDKSAEAAKTAVETTAVVAEEPKKKEGTKPPTTTVDESQKKAPRTVARQENRLYRILDGVDASKFSGQRLAVVKALQKIATERGPEHKSALEYIVANTEGLVSKTPIEASVAYHLKGLVDNGQVEMTVVETKKEEKKEESKEEKKQYRDWETDRKSTRLNSSHITRSRMPSSA